MTTSLVGGKRLNASTLLDRCLEAGRADADALITASGRVSYAELAGLTAGVAAYLTEVGVQREQRVLMVLDDSPAFVATFLGAMRIGAVPVPVNPIDRVENHVYYLRGQLREGRGDRCPAGAEPRARCSLRRPDVQWSSSGETVLA